MFSVPSRVATLMFLLVCPALAAQQSETNRDDAIRELLKNPPYFVDEQHPGPTMFPQGMGRLSAPLTCRSAQAFSHWSTPGAYHFQKAEYLLDLGFDFHGCEIFGLSRDARAKWTDLQRLEMAVREATAALQVHRGMGMWRPGAADYVLVHGLKELSRAVRKSGDRQRAADLSRLANAWEDRARSSRGSEKNPQENRGGCTARALLASAAEARIQSLENCLSANTDVDTRGPGGRTALMEAAFAGHAPVVEFLLLAGADVNATDNHGGIALREAVALGHEEVVDRLLGAGANSAVVDDDGNTALHDAAALGLAGIVSKLLTSGANPNIQSSDGTTPLMAALEGAIAFWAPRQIDTARHLLTARANVNLQNQDGTTALMLAARNHQATMAADLIRAGALLEATDNENRTALHWAADATALDVATVLLEHGAKPDSRTEKMETALILAAANGYGKSPHVAELLLRHGANPNARDESGRTPLMKAAHSIYQSYETFPEPTLNLFRVLVKYGADAQLRNNWGDTALHGAAGHTGPDTSALVQFLVAAGLDVNLANDRGTTPLMLAAEQGHTLAVRFLLDSGADPRTRNSERMTALDFAADWKNRAKYRPGCLGSTGNCGETRKILRDAVSSLSKKR